MVCVQKEPLRMFEVNPVIFELSNGIRVVYQKHEAFVAHLGAMVLGGSRFERENEEGLAHFLEHCIFKGTEKRKAFDVFTDLDSFGGELNAYTNKEEICVHASFRKIHFSIAAELIADIVLNSSFPESEIKKEKEVVLDEIISYLDTPSERIFDEFEEHIFSGHAIGRNTLGTKESVSGFTREQLIDYKNRLFTPGNLVISFVGNVSIDEVRSLLEEYFSPLTGDDQPKENGEFAPFVPFELIEKKANYQTHTVIGGRAPAYHDDDRRAMSLLINVLGGPAMNSRLNLSVRENYGYAYNVEAGFTSFSDTGIWSIYMGTDRKYLKKAREVIYRELDQMRNTPLTSEELLQAKEQIKGHLALSLDSNLELMLYLAKSLLIFGKIDTIIELYEEIDSITSEEIMQVASKWMNSQNVGEIVYSY